MYKLLILILLPTLLESSDKKPLIGLTGKITGSHCDDPDLLAWHELAADASKNPLQLKPVTLSFKLEKIHSYGMAFKSKPEEISSIAYQNLSADPVTRYLRAQSAVSGIGKHFPGHKDVPFVHNEKEIADHDVVGINTAGTIAAAQNVHYSAAHEQTNSVVNPNLNLPLEERKEMFAIALQDIEDFKKQLKKEREDAQKLAAAPQTDK